MSSELHTPMTEGSDGAKPTGRAPSDLDDLTAQIGQVLSSLTASADDRADRDSYQQIKNTTSLVSALRMADLLMTGIALDLGKVLREEHGLNFDADAWQVMLGLPGVRRHLQTQAVQAHGHAGSVDRAFTQIAASIRGGASQRTS